MNLIDLPPEDFQAFMQYQRQAWMTERRGILTHLDSLEALLGIEPTTAELRRKHKSSKIEVKIE
jgi:hypothetical protein